MPKHSARIAAAPSGPLPEPAPAPAPAPALEIEPLLRELSQRMLDALNRNTAAILAAGIMSSRGRPHTPEEALRLHQEMINTMWPRSPAAARAEENVPA